MSSLMKALLPGPGQRVPPLPARSGTASEIREFPKEFNSIHKEEERQGGQKGGEQGKQREASGK